MAKDEEIDLEEAVERWIDWGPIREVYLKGDDLRDIAVASEVSVPEIMLRAHTYNWGERGSESAVKEVIAGNKMTPVDVVNSHKDDLLRLRLTASVIQSQIIGLVDPFSKVKLMEKLANVYSKLIPLERASHNIDVNTGDAPNRINIFMNGQETPVVSEGDEE